jgi:hypothetical protein
VPTTLAQKRAEPKLKNKQRSIVFLRFVNFRKSIEKSATSRLPKIIDTCCSVTLALAIMKGINARAGPGGKGTNTLFPIVITSW